MECNVGEKTLSKHISYFSKRTEIPYFYQVHMGRDDYEISELRARLLPFTQFTREVLKI